VRHKIIPTRNVRSLQGAAERLLGRSTGEPGIGVVYGATGRGKTTAAAWLAGQTNAVFVRACRTWSPSWMLGSMMTELGAEPLGRLGRMVDFIVKELAAQGRPLIVDEVDYLADSSRLLDTLRDLHDMSAAPLILLGTEDFKKRVMHRPQLMGRVHQWLEFHPADFADARLFADGICEVIVENDLLVSLHRWSGGSLRALTLGLARIEEWAKRRGLDRINATDWSGNGFSDAPGEVKIPKAAAA
jgi:hypothetical protein